METTAEDIFAHVAARRRAVADLLGSLDDEQLSRPSLCAGWTVRTVGAHLAEAAAPGGLGPMLVALLRAGGRIHLVNDRVARAAGARPIAETVALLRQRADSRFTPPITGPRGPLTDVLVHEGDIRVPLGLPFEPEPDAVRIALEFVTTGKPLGFVRRGRLTALRLVATDLDWSWGDGAEVSGSGIDLLMAACGRLAGLTRLDGPGRTVLADRLTGQVDVR